MASPKDVEMVKISIALPNNTEISLEAADPDQLRPVVEMVRQHLLVELANLTTPPNGGAEIEAADEKGTVERATNANPPPKLQPKSRVNKPPAPSKTPDGPPLGKSEDLSAEPAVEPSSDPTSPDDTAVPPGLSDPRLARDFTVFCRAADPMGDMRKVVAAAEGARRHLKIENVDAWELGHLFDLAGWNRPHNFTQTLRNAARTSYRWLERVPGRSGRYTTTEKGRSVALGGTSPE